MKLTLLLILARCSASVSISSADTTVTETSTATTASSTQTQPPESTTTTSQVSPKLLNSTADIALTETGEGSYTFTYNGEQYTALYTPDNWKIIDSYKIRNKADMTVICEALISVYPIHGKDYESYRTPEDLAYEWEQHNIAYDMLPDTSRWKANTKDVDLNPEDQGKSFLDMARDRLGR